MRLRDSEGRDSLDGRGISQCGFDAVTGALGLYSQPLSPATSGRHRPVGSRWSALNSLNYPRAPVIPRVVFRDDLIGFIPRVQSPAPRSPRCKLLRGIPRFRTHNFSDFTGDPEQVSTQQNGIVFRVFRTEEKKIVESTESRYDIY